MPGAVCSLHGWWAHASQRLIVGQVCTPNRLHSRLDPRTIQKSVERDATIGGTCDKESGKFTFSCSMTAHQFAFSRRPWSEEKGKVLIHETSLRNDFGHTSGIK